MTQGVTVDRSFVLATPGMDRHLAYVGMTRHRDSAELYAGRDDFKGFDELRERLSRMLKVLSPGMEHRQKTAL
jgi:ATP-dependent exoDNAse (exonuclease V) alpha subunit